MDVDSLTESMSNLRIPRMPKSITFGRGTGYKGRFGNARHVEGQNYSSNFNSGQTSQHNKLKKQKFKEKESDNNDTQEVMEDVELNKN